MFLQRWKKRPIPWWDVTINQLQTTKAYRCGGHCSLYHKMRQVYRGMLWILGLREARRAEEPHRLVRGKFKAHTRFSPRDSPADDCATIRGMAFFLKALVALFTIVDP